MAMVVAVLCLETRVLCAGSQPYILVPADLFPARRAAKVILLGQVCFEESDSGGDVLVQQRGRYVALPLTIDVVRALGVTCDARVEVCVSEEGGVRQACVMPSRRVERVERVVHADRGVLLPRWAGFQPGEEIYACLDNGKVVYARYPVGDACRIVKVRRFNVGRSYVYGKVTIPAWFAHLLGITPGDCVVLEKDSDRVLLWRVTPRGKCLSYIRER